MPFKWKKILNMNVGCANENFLAIDMKNYFLYINLLTKDFNVTFYKWSNLKNVIKY
jgi:hypothetical protein